MWTSRNRARYDRSKLRYPSDVTDEEWELMVTADPARQVWRRQTNGDHARGGERSYVRSVDRLSVARNPERPVALSSTASFFNGERSTPGTIPATSQFDWPISITARVAQDEARSARRALHRLLLARMPRRRRGEAKKIGWNGLLVGDLSQPRGGPMLSGHTSHQVGLSSDPAPHVASRMAEPCQ